MPRRFNIQARQNILDVATRLFAERGYKAVSMEEIALASGVKKANLFYYYPTKETLAIAVQAHIREGVRSWISEVFPNEVADPIECVERFFAEFGVQSNGRHGFNAGIGSEMATSSEALRQQVAQTFDVWVERVADALEQARRRGYFRPDFSAGDTAKVLAALTEGAVLQMGITREAESIRFAAQAARTLLLSAKAV